MIANPDRSMHQDVPLYSMDLFTIIAPDEHKTEEILNDPHKLVISRLDFELSERHR
jgi:THO complex subunit 5